MKCCNMMAFTTLMLMMQGFQNALAAKLMRVRFAALNVQILICIVMIVRWRTTSAFLYIAFRCVSLNFTGVHD